MRKSAASIICVMSLLIPFKKATAINTTNSKIADNDRVQKADLLEVNKLGKANFSWPTDIGWSGNEVSVNSLTANVGGTTYTVTHNSSAGTVTVSGGGWSTTMSSSSFESAIRNSNLVTATTYQINGGGSQSLISIASTWYQGDQSTRPY